VRLKALFAVVFVLVASPAFPDASRLTAAEFLEMNETYRAALIHGLLASATALGLPEEYESVYNDGAGDRWQT
jgi:hypothetical protein